MALNVVTGPPFHVAMVRTLLAFFIQFKFTVCSLELEQKEGEIGHNVSTLLLSSTTCLDYF